MAEIQIKNISKSFGDTKVLDKISFQVQDGHFLSLLGPSGCGKTTLLRIIAGLEYADEGAVLVGGSDITQVPVEKRNIGVVFQNYALIPHMTVYNNIAYGLKLRKMDKKTIAQKVEEYIALVGLEGMENRKIPQLSGGQQQRVALARALLIQPPLLLLDEPLSALDRKIRGEMQYEIRRIQQKTGITTVFVTHDQEEAMTMSDEILLLHKGRVEQMDTPERLYNNPVSLYASDFLGKANTLAGTLELRDGVCHIRGNGWRLRAEARSGFQDGDQVCAAIRGEQILMRNTSGENTMEAVIESVIFTGEVCRIRSRLGGDEVSIACINMDGEAVKAGDRIYLEVPPQKVHYFKR